MKKILLLAVAGAFIMGCHDASAQRYALKTNAAVWATTSINAAFEVGLAQKTTLELGASYNPWIFSHNKKMRHWMFQPEFRYWTCGRFDRAFWGLHIMGGQFNAGGFNPPFDFYSELKKYRYQGWFAGVGISYGHNWYLSPRLNLEATIGAGYVWTDYTRYDCVKCGEKKDTGQRNYFGPTKVGLSLVYLF